MISVEIYSLSKSVGSDLIIFQVLRFAPTFQNISLTKGMLMVLPIAGIMDGSVAPMRKPLIFLSMPLMVVMRLRS